MAYQRSSTQRLWVLVLTGLGVILMVEYLKIAVFIGDYDVERVGIDGPLIRGEIWGYGNGKALRFKKTLSGMEHSEEKTMREEGAAALEMDKQLGSKEKQLAEMFARRLLRSEKGVGFGKSEERGGRESKGTGSDGADADRKLPKMDSQLLPKDNDGHGNSDTLPRISDAAEIYINTSRPVLNPHPFQYIINTPDTCKGTSVFLCCYVHTAVSHYKRRKRIRETWGNQTNYPGVVIKVVFFVGLPATDTNDGLLNQDYLRYESRKYGDLVQEDFLDTYKNLSHKGVGALKWISMYCNHASYVLKTDDDMFVNMYVILNHLRELHDANFTRRLMMCYVFWKMHVDREGGQWSLTKEYFPDDLYPPYCSGMGYVASTDVAIAMYRVSPYVPFLWVDDAFISGVLPAALQGAVNHTSWARAYCAAYEMGVYTHDTEWYKYIFSHVHNETLYLKTWNGLSNVVRTRTIPRPSVISPGLLADDYIPLYKLYPPQN